MAAVSDIVGGYRLRSLLHGGQTSQVFEAVEMSSNRHFAMKILLPQAAEKPEERRMLFNEAEVGIKMKHPNVVSIVKVNRAKGTVPYFVMEYFSAGSLRSRLQAKDFAFIKEHSRAIFKQVATGLAYMNASGYVHRDIKPENILVNASGETKIIDFAITKKPPTGFAKWFYKKKAPQGTPSFMSPEQINDEIPDQRMDIYSYGCTLYELAAGRPPFRAATTNDLLTRQLSEKPAPLFTYNTDVTEEFSNFVLKMLAKKKTDRPANFHHVLMDLRKIKQIYKSMPEKPAEESY